MPMSSSDAQNGMNAMGHARFPGPRLHQIEHLLLKVRGNDGPALAHYLCHRDREVPHAASDIGNRHAFVKVRADDRFRLVNHPPEGVIERPRQPPGADAFFFKKQALKRFHGYPFDFFPAPVQ